jgi:hypothetical protein
MILRIGDRLLNFAVETIRLIQRLEGLQVRDPIARGGKWIEGGWENETNKVVYIAYTIDGQPHGVFGG